MAPKKDNSFIYNSTQEHIVMVNGKRVGHSTHITIKNGKGHKKCIKYTGEGKPKEAKCTLSNKEMKAIKEKEYLPALFAPVMKQLRLGAPLRFSKTRKNNNKK
jgi:hypothetical protein